MNPITRRSALTTSLTTLLAAGAASMLQAAPEPAVAQAQPVEPVVVSKTVVLAPMLSNVVHTDDLVAESRRLLAEMHEASAESQRIYGELLDSATPEQRGLIQDLDVATTRSLLAESEIRFVEIARHLPGLYPTLRLLHEHVYRFAENIGRCCTLDAGYDPSPSAD